jgi:hypothetical protein
MSLTGIHQLIVGDVINIVFVQECLVNHPWGVRDDFVDPSTLTDGLTSLSMSHRRCRLVVGT